MARCNFDQRPLNFSPFAQWHIAAAIGFRFTPRDNFRFRSKNIFFPQVLSVSYINLSDLNEPTFVSFSSSHRGRLSETLIRGTRDLLLVLRRGSFGRYQERITRRPSRRSFPPDAFLLSLTSHLAAPFRTSFAFFEGSYPWGLPQSPHRPGAHETNGGPRRGEARKNSAIEFERMFDTIIRRIEC